MGQEETRPVSRKGGAGILKDRDVRGDLLFLCSAMCGSFSRTNLLDYYYMLLWCVYSDGHTEAISCCKRSLVLNIVFGCFDPCPGFYFCYFTPQFSNYGMPLSASQSPQHNSLGHCHRVEMHGKSAKHSKLKV